jgi:peptide/nickel transport system permease protein
MRNYILGRVVQTFPVVILVSLLIFAMFRMLPGSFVDSLVDESVEDFNREQLMEQLGLDRPLHVQYLDWAWGLVRFDLGESLLTKYSISKELAKRWPVTVELTAWSLLYTIVLGIPTGMLAAFKQDTLIDYIARTFAVLGLSVPNFWIGVVLITMAAIHFGVLIRPDYISFIDSPWGNFKLMLIPALITATSNTARIARMMRTTLLEVIREDYIRTAYSKGLSPFIVMARHAGRNAMIPVVTIIGLDFLQLISGTVVMESLFDLPGIGKFSLDAMVWKDFGTLQNIIFLYAIIVIIGNLLVDISYAYLDPRIRYGTGNS